MTPTVTSFVERFYDWDFVLMLVSLGVVLGFELLGIFTAKGYVTITALTREYVPLWGRWMVWGWLGYHFLLK